MGYSRSLKHISNFNQVKTRAQHLAPSTTLCWAGGGSSHFRICFQLSSMVQLEPMMYIVKPAPRTETRPNCPWSPKGRGAAVPLSQKVPVQPEVQVQAPLTWSQAAPFWHWQLEPQPGPKLPSGHPAAKESQPGDGATPEHITDQWGRFRYTGNLFPK